MGDPDDLRPGDDAGLDEVDEPRAGAWVTGQVRCGAAAKASSYAPLVTVASVPITPIRPLRVARTDRRTAGLMTSTTGTG